MVEVRPLRGVRFDRQVSGPLGPLLAPPYDASIDLARREQHSIAAIENAALGVPGSQHETAARRYHMWRSAGILRQDDAPSMYVHRHQFDLNGATRSRTGLIVRVRLADWEERVVLPHERTVDAPRAERLERLRTVGANLSPLYFLYRDPNSKVRDLLESVTAASAEPVDRDRMGGAHMLTTVQDPATHEAVTAALAEQTLFVADGHHRYEAALQFRNENRLRYGFNPDAPWEFVLVLLSAVEDPGVHVRPTHRIVSTDDPNFSLHALYVVRRWFTLRESVIGADLNAEPSFICRLVFSSRREAWDVFSLPGEPHHGLLPRDRGPSWKSLPVAAVQGILDAVAGGAHQHAHVDNVVEPGHALDRVVRGEAQAAFLLPPPALDGLLAVAEEGDLLPPKSTWFEPKAPAGLVINELTPATA